MEKVKAHLELTLAKDIKNNNKGFYKYIITKRKIRKNVGLLPKHLGVQDRGGGHREGRSMPQ